MKFCDTLLIKMSVTFEGLPMLSHLFQKSTQKLEYISAITVIISIFAKFASLFFFLLSQPQVSFFRGCRTPPHLNVHIQIISLPQNNSAAALLIVVSSKQHYSCSKSVVGIRKRRLDNSTSLYVCLCTRQTLIFTWHSSVSHNFIYFLFFLFFLP